MSGGGAGGTAGGGAGGGAGGAAGGTQHHVPGIPEALPGDKRSGLVRWLEALKAGEIKGGPG